MRTVRAIPLCALAAVFALGGCGGGGSGSTARGGNEETTGPNAHHGPGDGAAQFRSRGGDNSIQDFGSESGAAERADAAASLHAYFDARARGDWATACRYTATKLINENARLAAGSPLAGKGCAAVMAAIYSRVPAKGFADAAIADVGSFRVSGDRGFVLYHGSHHTDYAMPMVREGGRWEVALASGDPLY